jgi:DNA-binding beta-propeller fold protein YncE
LFVADGYTNKRVVVFDAETGAYRRHWGAYGNPPEDVDLGPYDPAAPPARQFLGPVHGIALSRDGLLYVTDRLADRIQVFRTNGEFVMEGFVSPDTRDLGTGYGIALSHDPEQRFVYVNDGSNNVIWILRRSDLVTVGSFSSYGRMGGQVMSAHSIAVDQQGNVYVGETRGRRVQRFAFRGFM